MRKQFVMSEEQHARLMDASKPVPYMVIGGVEPRSPAQNANAVWRELGREMGFDWDTAEPVNGKSDYHFTAIERASEGDK